MNEVPWNAVYAVVTLDVVNLINEYMALLDNGECKNKVGCYKTDDHVVQAKTFKGSNADADADADTSAQAQPTLEEKKLHAEEEEGTVGLRRSLRLKLLGEDKKHTTPPKRKAFNWRNATLEQIAEFGADLEYLRILPGKFQKSWGFGYIRNFTYLPGNWMHFNFEARSLHADPSHKPLVLFAELLRFGTKYHLITLSLMKPTDEVFGCNHCLTNISHPGHGFLAGFNTSEASEPKILSEQDAAKLSKFALEDFNKKHETNIKFERALKCCSFTCTGLLMDLDEKNTNWVRMNFSMVVHGSIKKVLRMFAELYLEDDGNYAAIEVIEIDNLRSR
ncbi:hypothetical protein PHJA_001820700 [Phtheirospermum japonicum]|uniref:Uncharacterized protein n=1 Tax=Phtheirospermum japonicum TaxID=374723 RepID=A0A830CC41_9LAMI|nr:hypothetical protein PHJA_001820700 [Phtheirospermum japonicum]